MWDIGKIPDEIIQNIGGQLVHHIATRNSDISGIDFENIFANSINGQIINGNGLDDVISNGNVWSVKTIKSENPHNETSIRIISGRNSVDYSFDIQNPHIDIEETGAAVLNIWNSRVNNVLEKHDALRGLVLIRNLEKRQFVIFENAASLYDPNNYEWEKNENENFEGYEKLTGKHKFTWQPNGNTFTVKCAVPQSAIRFVINKSPQKIAVDEILKLIKFDNSWVDIIKRGDMTNFYT